MQTRISEEMVPGPFLLRVQGLGRGLGVQEFKVYGFRVYGVYLEVHA